MPANEVEYTIKARDDTKTAHNAVEQNTSRFGSKLSASFAKMGPMLAAGMATAGLAAGAALVGAMASAIQAEDTKAVLEASLPPSEAKDVGEAAGRAFRAGLVPSMQEASDAVGAVKSSLGGLAEGPELDKAVRNALNFAKVFKVDVAESTATVQNMIKNGLAKDATEAFDLLTVSARSVPEALRGEIFEAANEYGQFFNQLGIDGPGAFDLLTRGAQKGQYGIDKAGDAIKEFTIRATDGSKTTGTAFQTLGLDMGKMSNDLLAGGETSRKAFDTIIGKLQEIKDPSKQAQTALALFGTPLEDLSTKDIPDFLRNLSDLGGGMGKVAGASEDMNSKLETNARKIQSWKNRATSAMTNFGGQAIEAMEKLADSPAAKRAVEILEDKILPAARRLGNWLSEKLVPVINDLADRAMKGWNTATREISETIEENRDEIEQLQRWLKKTADFIMDKVVPAVGPAFSGSIRGTIEMVKGIIRQIGFWINAFNKVKNAAGAAADFVTNKYDRLAGFMGRVRSRVGRSFDGMFDGIKFAFRNAVNWVVDRWNNFSIPGVSTPFGTMGGFNTPNIPRMASGGVSGGLAGGWTMAGERGAELLRLPVGTRVSSAGDTQRMLAAMGGGSPDYIEARWVAGAGPADDFLRWLIDRLRLKVKREAGGNAQRFWVGT